MHQIGAALTDWGVSAACCLSLLALHRHGASRRRQGHAPRWYDCFMCVYAAEGISCLAGGFMWSSGANKTCVLMAELEPATQMWCFLMIQGMCSEGLGLILASRELMCCSEGSPFLSQAMPETLTLAASCVLYGLALAGGASISLIYKFLMPLAAGLASVSVAFSRKISSSKSAEERRLWTRLLAGQSLNVFGAVVTAGLDNDCTGLGCITEGLPWESSPCRYGLSEPVGSSCPLPEWFNHAAVMHSTAILSCAVCVPALCGLLDLRGEDAAAVAGARGGGGGGAAQPRPAEPPGPRRRGGEAAARG